MQAEVAGDAGTGCGNAVAGATAGGVPQDFPLYAQPAVGRAAGAVARRGPDGRGAKEAHCRNVPAFGKPGACLMAERRARKGGGPAG